MVLLARQGEGGDGGACQAGRAGHKVMLLAVRIYRPEKKTFFFGTLAGEKIKAEYVVCLPSPHSTPACCSRDNYVVDKESVPAREVASGSYRIR